MLTTIYLMLAVCSGVNNCHYGIMESFEGTKQNAVEACNIARQGYPKSSIMDCYVLQGEDESTEYYENVNADEFLEIYK